MRKINNIKNKTLKVLVLEDSLQDAELLVAQLSEAGYQLVVTHTENEAQFIEALEKNSYDIVLSDFSLPTFDAFGALEICQKLCPEVPFICVSGSIGEELAIDLLKKGAVDYVLKDRPARLPYAVQYALDKVKEKAALHKTALELQESEKRFRQVAEIAQEWIWEVDTNGMYTYASPVIKSLLGYTQDEVVGKKYFYDFFAPEKRNELKTAACEVFAKRENFNDFENILVHKNGQLVVASTSGSKVFDEDGNFKGYRGVDEDITKRRQAEEKLRESEYRYRKIYEDGASGMVMVDKDFKFISANRAFCQMIGYQEEELQKLTFVDITHPDDSTKDINHVNKMIAGQSDVYTNDKRYLNKNGQTIWAQITASPFYDSNGQFLFIIGIIVNITDRKKAEVALLAKMDELERFQKLTVGREITMVALKKEVNNLLNKLGKDNKYKIVE